MGQNPLGIDFKILSITLIYDKYTNKYTIIITLSI